MSLSCMAASPSRCLVASSSSWKLKQLNGRNPMHTALVTAWGEQPLCCKLDNQTQLGLLHWFLGKDGKNIAMSNGRNHWYRNSTILEFRIFEELKFLEFENSGTWILEIPKGILIIRIPSEFRNWMEINWKIKMSNWSIEFQWNSRIPGITLTP